MVLPVVLASLALVGYFLTKPKSKEIKKEELSYPFKKDEENQKKNKTELISRMEESGFNVLYEKTDKIINKENLDKNNNLPKKLDKMLEKLREIQQDEKNIVASDIMKIKTNNLMIRMEKLENTKENKKDFKLKKERYNKSITKEFWKDLPKEEKIKLIKRTGKTSDESEKYAKMTWKKISEDRINEGSNALSGFVNFAREKYNNKN
jgi:hypothetical protein